MQQKRRVNLFPNVTFCPILNASLSQRESRTDCAKQHFEEKKMSHLDLGPWLAENGLVPAGPVQTAEAAKVIAEAVSAQTAGNKKSFLTFMVGSFLSTTLGEDAGRQDIDGMSSDSLLQVAAACWRKLGVAGRPGATAKAIVDAKSGIEASALWRQSLEPSPAATPEEPPLIHPGRPTTPNARGAAPRPRPLLRLCRLLPSSAGWL